jgi:glycosyltransferase involved in cell wall biosynthesis
VTGRPRLLFVTPALPAEGGNGLAMRAGLFLEALAADHEVHLLVVPVSGPPADVWPPFVVSRTAQRTCLDLESFEDPRFRAALAGERANQVASRRAYPGPALARFSTAAAVEAAALTLALPAVDVVHVLRLYLAPFVAAAPGRPLAVLDLDDDEVETRRRLAALHAGRGEAGLMTLEAAEAAKYRDLERAWLGRFDAVLVCSERDRAAVAGRSGHPRVCAIPNGARRAEPAALRPDAGRDDQPFRILFVGTLGYFPNVDAATTLCRDVLPRLQANAPRAVVVDLVGARPAPAVVALAETPGVRVHADVQRLGPFYERADAVVVPLRAGGGTRIKLLEAFAHGVPVVSTSVGVEGLDVEPGRHLLVADDAEGLAAACRLLMEDRALGHRLGAEAVRLVATRYDARRVVDAIRSFLRDGVTARGGHP